MILFIVGWFTMITWWIGACCIGAANPSEKTFKTVNIVFTVLSVIGVVIVPIIWYFTAVAVVATAIKTK